MNVKCAVCGERIKLFVNDMASPGEVWPFCAECSTYVDVVPGDWVALRKSAKRT